MPDQQHYAGPAALCRTNSIMPAVGIMPDAILAQARDRPAPGARSGAAMPLDIPVLRDGTAWARKWWQAAALPASAVAQGSAFYLPGVAPIEYPEGGPQWARS